MTGPTSPQVRVAWRVVAASCAWVLRFVFHNHSGSPPSVATVVVDALLVFLWAWTFAPKRKADPSFGRPYSANSVSGVPAAVAVFLLARDMWFLIKDLPV
jgi:hypothetical protein